MSDRNEAPGGLSPAEVRQIAQIRGGSAEAFEALFRAHESLVYGVCLSMVGTPDVARDLTQDLFCDLWDRRQRLRPRLSLKAYLAGAARNRAISWIRKNGARELLKSWDALEGAERHELQRSDASPLGALQHRDLRHALRLAIAELPARRRLIYTMARHEHMSYAEIAAALDISVNTVKTQMGRALKFLRRRLRMYEFASQSN
jgi:RNA polymerase sigma-70 factor (ECF subfamily)